MKEMNCKKKCEEKILVNKWVNKKILIKQNIKLSDLGGIKAQDNSNI